MKRSLASIAVFLALTAGAAAENPKVTLAIPVNSTSFTFAYVADAIGAWKQEGLDAEVRLIPGLGATNAMLSGQVEFSAGSGQSAVLATARGQKPLIIATMQDRLTFEVVVSKAIAEATPPTASIEERAKALKGKTIAVDAVGSIQQGYAKYIVAKGGLNPDTDATYTPIQSPAMTAALAAGRVDALSAVPPWSTQAVSEGAGVMYVSSPQGDLPELAPFAVTAIATRPEYCQQNADICKKFVKGLQNAVTFIHEHPDKALEIMKTKFADMDQAVLEAGFKYAEAATPKTIQTSDVMLENAKLLAAQSGALKPDEKVPPVSQIYTNDYQP